MCQCNNTFKVGDKVRYNKRTNNHPDHDKFSKFYNVNTIYTVGTINHGNHSGWNQYDVSCFIRFKEFEDKGFAGWGAIELEIVKKRKQKLKIP